MLSGNPADEKIYMHIVNYVAITIKSAFLDLQGRILFFFLTNLWFEQLFAAFVLVGGM